MKRFRLILRFFLFHLCQSGFLLTYKFALFFVWFGSGDRGMMSMAGGMAQAMLSKPGGNVS